MWLLITIPGEKCTFFLQGIKDNAYDAIKDLVSEMKFEEIVLRLRAKAAELGKHNFTRSRDTIYSNYKEINSEDKKKILKNSKQNQDEFRLPPDVWNGMSKEQKNLWNNEIIKI
jgi:predicted PolB exonuclease-like 3'-5' exonuclease